MASGLTIKSISGISKPVIVASKPNSESRFIRKSSSIFKISLSQPDFSANLLSAIIYARTCSGVICAKQIVGTLSNPNSFAASTLP